MSANRIIAVQDRAKHNLPVYVYGVCKILALCSIIGGKFVENIETSGFDYFTEVRIPELATEKNNEVQIKMCFEAYHAENWRVQFD